MDYPKALYIFLDATPGPVTPFQMMLPGKVHVAMDVAKERNGILLPLSNRITPDTGVIVASGDAKLRRMQGGRDIQEPAPPKAGTRVLVIPYTGVYLDDHSRILPAQGYAWYETLPAALVDGEVLPLYDWLLVERNARPSTLTLPDSQPAYASRGHVHTAGPLAAEFVGEEVAILDSEAVYTFRFGGERALCLVRVGKVLGLRFEV